MNDQTNLAVAEHPDNTLPFPDRGVRKPGAGRIALGFVPFTPVHFHGSPDSWIAYVRIGLYATLAYFTYNKMRPVSYAAMAAAGVSLTTSLIGKAWEKQV